MTHLVRIAATLFVVLLLAGSSWAQTTTAPTRPNIIWIMADDLGWGDLSCYGQKRLRTPSIDRLATEGMRFTQFYAGSTVCAPSRCVLMTGLHTGHAFIRANSRKNLRPRDVTVAEVLQKAGYRCGLVGKWGLAQEGTDGVPNKKGFDFFYGYLNQRHAHNYYPTFLIRNQERVALPNVVPKEDKTGAGKASKKVAYSHDLMMEEALGFIDRNAKSPFFLYLALTIPHANNEARREGMEVPDFGPQAKKDWPAPEKGFAGMLHRMDRDVGRLMARLAKLGLDENTLVMFTSDNGPHREGGHDPKFFDSNGPLRGIKRSLHDGGIRVPLIARWPGRIKAKTTSDHIAYFGDFLATAADLAGAKTTPPTDGISFAPVLLGRGQEQEEHDWLYWEFHEGKGAEAVRRGRWKAVRKPIFDGITKLYDLDADPGEQVDLAKRHPRVVRDLENCMGISHVPLVKGELRPARTEYMGRRIAKTMHWLGADWLERRSREREENTQLMFEKLGLQPGQTVCDFGAGSGYHSLPMARSVGEKGRILAVDIQGPMLDRLQDRAKKAGINNIRPVHSTIVNAKLKTASCDIILLVDVYHELGHPEVMLNQLRRALKPKGRIVVVEFRLEDPKVPIKKLHKMSKAQILKEFTANGLTLVEQFDGLPWQHMMSFGRGEPAPKR